MMRWLVNVEKTSVTADERAGTAFHMRHHTEQNPLMQMYPSEIFGSGVNPVTENVP